MKALIFLAAVLSLTSAHAQLSGTVGAGARYAAVAEYDESGVRIIREDGWLPGIKASLAYQQGAWQLFSGIMTYRGDLDYDGRLQRGSAYHSETETDHDRLQFGLRYSFANAYGVSAAFEYDRWKRNIRGSARVIGLQERTSSRRLVLGVQKAFPIGSIGAMQATASVVRAEPERLRVGFSGALEPVSLETQAATGYRIGFVFRPEFFKNLEFGLELDRMKIGRSQSQAVVRNGRFAGSVTQPEHVRKHATVTIAHRF